MKKTSLSAKLFMIVSIAVIGVLVVLVASFFQINQAMLAATGIGTTAIVALSLNALVKQIKNELGGDPAEISKMIRAIEKGDLSKKINIQAENSNSILAAVSQLRDSLFDTFVKIRQSTREINLAAQDLCHSSDLVSRSATKQTESTETMAAAVEEMSVSITTVSDNACATANMANQACHLASAGNETILTTIRAINTIEMSMRNASVVINELGAQSQQISGIAGAIKEIADQTNLLALNAAIEAARAGDAGRGFAVVADEVRQLAEKTARSTKEISAVIDTIQNGTEAAVRHMNLANSNISDGVTSATAIEGTMDNVDKGARTALVSITEIAEALKEQSAASHDLAKNVENISQSMEQNGNVLKEVVREAEGVRNISRELERLVGNFRV